MEAFKREAVKEGLKHHEKFQGLVNAVVFRRDVAAPWPVARAAAQTGSAAAFMRSMLNRLLTLRSGRAAISVR